MLLLGVARSEQEHEFDRLETTLGTKWKTEDLLREAPAGGGITGAGELPTEIRIPLLLGVASDFIRVMTEDLKKSHGNKLRGSIDIGTLPKAQAKALFDMAFRNLPPPASVPATGDE